MTVDKEVHTETRTPSKWWGGQPVTWSVCVGGQKVSDHNTLLCLFLSQSFWLNKYPLICPP